MINRVDKALARQHLVLRGRTTTTAGPSVSWAYGPRHRFEEFTGTGKPFLAQGTALIDGKLTGVYVTYYNHEWSLPQGPAPASACSRGAAIEMAGRPIPATGTGEGVADDRAAPGAITGSGSAEPCSDMLTTGRPTCAAPSRTGPPWSWHPPPPWPGPPRAASWHRSR